MLVKNQCFTSRVWVRTYSVFLPVPGTFHYLVLQFLLTSCTSHQAETVNCRKLSIEHISSYYYLEFQFYFPIHYFWEKAFYIHHSLKICHYFSSQASTTISWLILLLDLSIIKQMRGVWKKWREYWQHNATLQLWLVCIHQLVYWDTKESLRPMKSSRFCAFWVLIEELTQSWVASELQSQDIIETIWGGAWNN